MFDIAIIENKIGYTFKDKSLVTTAFTHVSFSVYSYENLEFLGDSVLSLVVSEYLYEKYPNFDQGKLTKARAQVVDKPPLKQVILSLGIEKYIMLGTGEKQNHLEKGDKLCGDLFEALLGAIYLDGGYANAKKFVLSGLEKTINEVVKNKDDLTDFKSKLFELCQKKRIEKHFLYEKTGEDHNPIFTAILYLDGKEVSRAKGTSKKKAEQTACQIALKTLD